MKENTVIAPTVGRVVWYWPSPESGIARIGGQPLAATVAGVWSDTCVNLGFLDANGKHRNATSVLLVQPGAVRPDADYCEWMPYQKGQAAKTDSVADAFAERLAVIEARLADPVPPPDVVSADSAAPKADGQAEPTG